MPAPPDRGIDLTISIATYDRNALLEGCIKSCLAQRNALGLVYEIAITDNHPDALAHTLVERMAADSAVPIRYLRETARNMSILRNASVHDARGAYLCFIDDDEFADPDWTDDLMGALRRTGADIAAGPRLAIFESGHPPPYDPTGRAFERHCDLPPDAVIPLVRPDGKAVYRVGTGNSIYDVAACFAGDPEPFKIAFGDGHGEDTEILMRLYKEGRKIVWAANARVTEVVMPHRLEVGYRLLLARRETNVYVMHYLEHTQHPRRVQLILAFQGLLQLAAGCALTLLTWEFGSKSRIKGRKLVIVGLGKLTWRTKPIEFIEEGAA